MYQHDRNDPVRTRQMTEKGDGRRGECSNGNHNDEGMGMMTQVGRVGLGSGDPPPEPLRESFFFVS